MRPLPVLDDLPLQPDVYQDSQDNFLNLFGDLFSQHDSLLSDLAGQQQAYSDGLDPFSSTIDAVDTALNDLISAFDLISNDLLQVDLSLVIAESQQDDQNLEDNLNSWAPDLGAISNLFTGILGDFLNSFLSPIFDTISGILNTFEVQIEDIFNSLVGLSSLVDNLLSGGAR